MYVATNQPIFQDRAANSEVKSQCVENAGANGVIDGTALPICHHAKLWVECLFEPHDILELRAIPPKRLIESQAPAKFIWSFFRRQHAFDAWVRADQLPSVQQQLRSFNHLDGVQTRWGRFNRVAHQWECIEGVPGVQHNIYCSANPRRSRGGTKADDVPLARSLFGDIEDVSIDEALLRIEAVRLPMPTVLVNSGHGVHPYWRLDAPLTDLSVWSDLQKRLAELLAADPVVHDPPRIMRLPGFVNCNGTPSLSYIVHADPHRRVSLEAILAHLPPAAASVPASTISNPHTTRPKAKSTHIQPITRTEILSRAIAYQSHWQPPDIGQRNGRLFTLATQLVDGFDLTLDELAHVVEIYNGRCDVPLDGDELQQVADNAYRHVHKQNRHCGAFLHARPVVEPFTDDTRPVITLDECRQQMQQARLESLEHPGSIYFDGSATGAGKSTADLVAMKQAKASVTFVPTHSACNELVEKLAENGIAAAAYPPLDESTCQRFGTKTDPGDARIAQRSGLDVGTALCPDCPLFATCLYQIRREDARFAAHAVATQARASHSTFGPAMDKEIIFVHEDFRNLLRPTIRVTQHRLSKAPQSPCLDDLKTVLSIAQEAKAVARSWDDVEKMAFCETLVDATKHLIDHLGDDQLLEQVTEAHAASRLAEVNRVRKLPHQPHVKRPGRLDHLLYRAMTRLNLRPNGDALRLCVAHASGELESLCLVIDDTSAGKKDRRFHKSLVGVRRVELPDNKIIWFEDATGCPKLLERLAARPVLDRTPVGRIEYQVPPIQYPLDVTMQASGQIVRGLLRGLLLEYPNANKVGLITHQCHLSEINKLERRWKDRIHRQDYFHSGNDRASNRWLDCDLLIILGTPRVPPVAVREGLIQVGEIAAAGKDGRWGWRFWEGKSTTGSLLEVQGMAYRHPAWRNMHYILVADALRQAVGRGRGVINTGVPVVAVTTERIDLPLAADPLTPLPDGASQVYEVATELTALSPKDNTVGKSAVTTASIVAQCGLQERQVRKYCNLLVSLGLLTRKGQRGGWLVNSKARRTT